MVFCERLRDLRTEKQLTQKQLAQSLGFSANIICEWEKARCEPNSETLKNLADFFDVSIDYLLGRSDELGTVVIKHDNPTDELTTEERALVADYRSLSPALQEMVRATIATWKGTDANKSSTNPRRA